MYKAEEFVCYQALAKAVIKTYNKDLEREYKLLLKAKENLYKRIRYGRSQGLVRRWNENALKAWESWNQSFERFDEIFKESESADFQLFKELAECKPRTKYKSASKLQLSCRGE